MLSSQVTIVVTPKDFHSCAIEALEQLWLRTTPRAAAVLYMATGPRSSRLQAYIEHCEAHYSWFQAIHCKDFANFYELRNQAARVAQTQCGRGRRPSPSLPFSVAMMASQ